MPRRPLTSYGWIACDDACHKRRGSLGGTDYAVVLGTPVYAMFSGMARYRVAGTGGWTVTINRDVDYQVGELMHLSRSNGFVLGGASRHVNEGDLVAWSGGAYKAPGSGSSTGPHLHAHVYINGRRYGMEEYLATPSWAGGTPIVIDELLKLGISDMPLVMNRTADNVLAIYDDSHWQEFDYAPTATATIKQYQLNFVEGMGHSLPNIPYDAVAWDQRSNRLPALKRPLFTDTGTEIVRIETSPGGPADNGPVLDAVASVSAQISNFPPAPTAAENGQAARNAIVK